jgi:DNA polymerase-3 subunit epsilon
MKALFFDTETTGLVNFKTPLSDEEQPHITQLAWILVDTDINREVASAHSFIIPEGWVCPEGSTAITGITTEHCANYGLPLYSALQMFLIALNQTDLLVAHNISFDMQMVMISSHQIFRDDKSGEWIRKSLDSKPKFCTAHEATNILKIPHTPRGLAAGFPYRSPTLSVAYKWATGEELVGAHGAMADTRACWSVYNRLKGTAQ